MHEFLVPLKEKGCKLSIFYDDIPPMRVTKESWKYKINCCWEAPSVIRDHDQLFQTINENTTWKRQNIDIRSTRFQEPRDTAWFADSGCMYSYKNVDPHDANEWSPSLLELKHTVEEMTNITTNSALLNRYNNEKDYMGRHADNERELGEEPQIVSVTLGCARRFRVIHNDKTENHVLFLAPGSIITMQGKTQQYYKHAIMKETKAKRVRINVTFRTIYPHLYEPKSMSSEPSRIFESNAKVHKHPAGEIPSIQSGTIFKGRSTIWKVGVHGVPMGGICANLREGATSILVAANAFNMDETSRIIFAGSGGDSKNNCPLKNQKLKGKNLGLLISMIRKIPIRVVRRLGKKEKDEDEEYLYSGANFHVTMVFSKLVEIPNGKLVVMWFFIIEQQFMPQLSDKEIGVQNTQSCILEIMDNIMCNSKMEYSFSMDDPEVKPFFEGLHCMAQIPQVYQNLNKEGSNKLFVIRFDGEQLRIYSRPPCVSNMLDIKYQIMAMASSSPKLKRPKVEGPDLATSPRLKPQIKKSRSTALENMLNNPETHSKTQSTAKSVPSPIHLDSPSPVPSPTTDSAIKPKLEPTPPTKKPTPPSPPKKQLSKVPQLVPQNDKSKNILSEIKPIPSQLAKKQVINKTLPQNTTKQEPLEDSLARLEIQKKRPLDNAPTTIKKTLLSSSSQLLPPSSPGSKGDSLPEPKKKKQKSSVGPASVSAKPTIRPNNNKRAPVAKKITPVPSPSLPAYPSPSPPSTISPGVSSSVVPPSKPKSSPAQILAKLLSNPS